MVIAAYNEQKHIASVVSRVKRLLKDVIVVDDGSRDETYALAQDAGALVLRHIINLGKGAAIKTGCDYALKQGAEALILVDADGQHDPKEIPRFIEMLKEKDIVFGYRNLTKNMPFVFSLGNRSINLVTYLLYGIYLNDTQSGYRALTADTYRKVRWRSTNYSMESEMVANVGKHHLKFGQLRIRTKYNDKYKGTTMVTGIKIVLDMLWWKITRW